MALGESPPAVACSGGPVDSPSCEGLVRWDGPYRQSAVMFWTYTPVNDALVITRDNNRTRSTVTCR
jgi:hypothetical protein